MRSEPIPDEMREKIASDPKSQYCYRRLALRDHQCEGRITWEHAIKYNGKRVNEIWAIVPLCAKAHSVDQYQDIGIMDKRINEWIALNRMKKADERKYPKFNWEQRRTFLNGLFGKYQV